MKYMLLTLIAVSFVLSCSLNRGLKHNDEIVIAERRDFLPPEYPDAEFLNDYFNKRYIEFNYHPNYQPILGKKEGIWYQFVGDATNILITVRVYSEDDSCDVRLTTPRHDLFHENIKDCSEQFKLENLEKILRFDEKVFFEDREGYLVHDTWLLTRVIDGEYKMASFFNEKDKKIIKETKIKFLKFFNEKMKFVFRRLHDDKFGERSYPE